MMQDSAAELREELAGQLAARQAIRSPEVAAAFRAVPRHVFLPGTGPAEAYADEAIPTRWAADGRPVSSSSQPSIMAIMLEQLGARPGQRVLEIGTGTGYNAALLAHLAGGSGTVVSVDIDQELTGAARRHLVAAGYPQVVAACADGAGGWPGGAPYDRIIVTASARDLAPAWLGQLASRGRLLLPLALRGVQQSVAFERAAGHLVSTSVVPCGFMPMTGMLAGADPVRQLGEVPGLFLRLEGEPDLDLPALYAALSEPRATVPTGVTVSPDDLFGGLALWLALHDPAVGELTAVGKAAAAGTAPALVPLLPGMRLTRVLAAGSSLAAVTGPGGTGRRGAFEATVCGYGRRGGQLADRLAALVRDWQAAGRPHSATLRIRAYPAGCGEGEAASFTITRPHTRFLLDWPAG